MSAEFRTPIGEYRHELEPIKGSRFVATVGHAAGRAEAEAFVERLRAEFKGATHNCWAWRSGRAGELFRSSDDGEPGGSAGRPILAQIDGHGLNQVALVVTRWFGGTKLGVGGLMRAYGGAAGQALDRAPLRVLRVLRRVALELPYNCSGAVQSLLAARGLEPLESDYGSAVHLVVELPEADWEAFRRELLDRTAGRARID